MVCNQQYQNLSHQEVVIQAPDEATQAEAQLAANPAILFY